MLIIQEQIPFEMKILVEYSKKQNAFHRTTEKEREQNETFLREIGEQSDYTVIGIFESIELADKFIEENYELIKNCRMYKNDEGECFII
jgi:hypothetical protein